MTSIVARISMGMAGAGVAAVLTAPIAQADYSRGSCLVVENNRATAVEVTVKNKPYTGKSWVIDRYTDSVLSIGGRKIVNSDGGWRIVAPQGQWRFDRDMYDGRGCNGTWIYRVS
ncbi:hypothetical protein [Nocardia sp. NPDC050435]|uniref:hypothetical protein n=1 Tax=Nocardia sp. NPDC050435 TaxID=3155040 RepID=UPI0033DD917E